MALYHIAGVYVDINPLHSLSASRCEHYRVSGGTADFSVVGEGDANEEYAALARSFYEQLLSFDGFLLHASAVELNGKAYAFSAPSGTGKSTHTAFWRTELGALPINDDKPAIRMTGDVFSACGTPFSGKHDISRNVCVPLGAIVFLTRSAEVTVRRLSDGEALYALLGQTLRPTDAPSYDRLLTLLEKLLATVPVFEAGVPNHPSAAQSVYRALCAE